MRKAAILLGIFMFCFTHGAPNFPTITLPKSSFPFDQHSGRPFTVTVQGNLGAGKTTFLENFFMSYPDIGVHTEPLEIWQNLSGTNFLDLVYMDQARWGMTFESLVTLTMMETHLMDKKEDSPNFRPVKVMERSVHSARAIFMELLKPLMTEGEMTVLESWYDLINERPEFDVGVDLIVYLRTSPETAMARVKSRGRQEEEGIPLDYFQNMHRLHEDWLVHRNNSCSSRCILPQVITIDANPDLSDLAKTYSDLAEMIWKIIPEKMRTVL